MNPLLEKYEELYGPKVEETITELPEDYLYHHCHIGEYTGHIIFDEVTQHNIEWNGKHWEKKEYVYNPSDNQLLSGANSYTGIANTDPFCLGKPVLPYNTDYIDFTNPQSSLMIDGKNIKDVIKEEVERQLKKYREITDRQTQSVLNVLEKVKKGEVKIKSYNETVSHDLGGSTTYYTIELEK